MTGGCHTRNLSERSPLLQPVIKKAQVEGLPVNVDNCISPVSTTGCLIMSDSNLPAIQNDTQVDERPSLNMSKGLQHAVTFLSEEGVLEHSLQSLCGEKPYHSISVTESIGREMARLRRPSRKGLSPTGPSKSDLLSIEKTFTEVFSGAVREIGLRFFSSKWHSVFDPGVYPYSAR